MFEVAVKTVGDILTHLFIQVPGAFVRSLIIRKKSFKSYLKEDWEANFVPVFILLGTLLLIVNTLRNSHG